MRKIGIVSIGENREEIAHRLFNKDDYITIQVFEKKQLIELDGVVLDVHEGDRFHEVCEWLINCQSVPNVFVWAVLPEVNLREINVYFHLGINGCILQENKVTAIPLVINNTFKRIACDYGEEIDDNIFLNSTNMSVIINGKEEISLTRYEYLILQILYREKGSTVSYQSIYEALWNKQPENDVYRIANLIFHLRKKIEGQGEHFIQTVRTKGYRLIV